MGDAVPSKPHEAIATLKRQADAGPAILQFSFRPFFLLAGIWAALTVPLWIGVLSGLPILPANVDPLLWHQHEMLFGFVAAAIAGFLLTAVPNWTAQLPVSGWRLGLLVLAWLIGRGAFFIGDFIGPVGVAVLDLVFLVSLVSVIARELLVGRNLHNVPVLLVLTLFTVGNVLFHLEGLNLADTAILGLRLAIFMVMVLIAVIGGRVVPSFTRNWLSKNAAEKFPAPVSAFDSAAIAALAIFAVASLIWPLADWVGGLGIAVGCLHLWRLARWRGHTTFAEPLVWVLHLGYAWLSVGILSLGLAPFVESLTHSQALHVVMAGGFGTMILAMATRTSLGHTGRPLVAGPGTVSCYLLVSLSALLRFSAPLAGSAEMTLLWAAATAWFAAFGLFAVIYYPILTRPRVEKVASGLT